MSKQHYLQQDNSKHLQKNVKLFHLTKTMSKNKAACQHNIFSHTDDNLTRDYYTLSLPQLSETPFTSTLKDLLLSTM